MRIGLPKGRLLRTSARVLRAFDLEPGSSMYRAESADVGVWLLKLRDIPKLVADGDLDLGIAPDEWIEECGPGCERIAAVDGYRTRVSVLAPVDRVPDLDSTEELSVATEFPNITRRHFARRRSRLRVLEMHGSTEACAPGLADLVVDCVETGATAREHGLAELFPLLESRLHVIASPTLAEAERHGPVVDLVVEAASAGRTAAHTAT